MAVPIKPKPAPTVTISLTVTYPAKENMTLADLAGEGDKAKKLMEQAKQLGTVAGHVIIGKQKFAL